MSIAFNACVCTGIPVCQFIDQTVHVDKLINLLITLSACAKGYGSHLVCLLPS